MTEEQSSSLSSRETARRVFAVLQEYHRQGMLHSELWVPAADLRPDMSVAEWLRIDQLSCDEELGTLLNLLFGTAVSPEAWGSVLRPAEERTVQDICRLIASASPRTSEQREDLLAAHEIPKRAGSCSTAGSGQSVSLGSKRDAFLVIRDLLAGDGADVSQLNPYQPLAPYVRNHFQLFTNRLPELAPELRLEVETPLSARIFRWAAILGFVAAMCADTWVMISPCGSASQSVWFQPGFWVLLSGGVCLAGWVGMRIVERLPVRGGRLVGLETFRDLCKAMEPQRASQRIRSAAAVVKPLPAVETQPESAWAGWWGTLMSYLAYLPTVMLCREWGKPTIWGWCGTPAVKLLMLCWLWAMLMLICAGLAFWRHNHNTGVRFLANALFVVVGPMVIAWFIVTFR